MSGGDMGSRQMCQRCRDDLAVIRADVLFVAGVDNAEEILKSKLKPRPDKDDSGCRLCGSPFTVRS